MKSIRIALIGWGAINRRVAELLLDQPDAGVEIVAVGVAGEDRIPADLPSGAQRVWDPDKLEDCLPDIVIEAAGRDAVKMWGEAALKCADTFIACSTSAFCDEALLDHLRAVAVQHGSQVVVPPGALGGIDVLSAAAILPLDNVVHRIVKPAKAWQGTRAEQLVDLASLRKAETFFSGSARDAASAFPQNANVTVITAIAGLGLDHTRVELVADPNATGNCHQLHATGQFGRLELTIENRPLACNPKSSETTALNLVRLVLNRVRPVAV